MSRLRIVRCAVLLLAFFGDPRSALADDPGYALRFDGVSDFVTLNYTSSILFGGWENTKTVEVWVKPTGTYACTYPGNPATCDAIFGDRPRWWGISRGPYNGLDRIWVWNWDGNLDAIGITYSPGEWMHIALVHSGGTLMAYKNGVLIGSVASGSTQQPSTGGLPVLQLGGVINTATRNWTFEGELDEVRIWSAARTAQELFDNMNLPLAGFEPGLAAYYSMSDGAGTSLTDDSGHGWTGTLRDGINAVLPDGPITWVPSGAFGYTGPPPPTNTAPVADPQDISTPEDTDVAIVLAGFDADNDPLTFRVVSPPSHGSLDGSAPILTYTPSANYHGADSFAFVVNDGVVDSAAAVVSIAVVPVNDRPVAADDTARTAQDTEVVVSVLANDEDVDGDSLTITAVSTPSHGSVTVTSDSSQISYVPELGYQGMDVFTYTITDGHGEFVDAEVTVTVRPPGADPGHALRFDGVSDFVTLDHATNIFFGGWESTKTVEVWVNPTGTTSCSYPSSPMSCDAIFGDRPRWWGISRGPYNGLDRIWVWNWDGNLDAVGITYAPGEWVHIALVHGDGMLAAYKNGVLVGSVASGPTQQPNTGALPMLHVGGIINNATRNWTFEGEIDELRIWNTARTAQELIDNMSQPLAGFELGLAAYYSMFDGSGTSLTDDSLNSDWTGTLWDGYNAVPPDGPILWVPSGAFSTSGGQP